MAAFVKFYIFVQDQAHKVNHLGSDELKIMLSNTAPSLTNTVKTDVSEISPGNGYAAGGTVATRTSSAQTLGVYKLVLADVVFTASGGSIGPFRYAVLYNNTPATKPLIGYWDYGASVARTDTQTFTVDMSAANGVLQFS